MTLPAQPPRYATFTDLLASINEGEKGWRGYALQQTLNGLRSRSWPQLVPDGIVGAQTITALRAFQSAFGLTADGKAGPMTQAKLLEILGAQVSVRLPELPGGLMRGFAESEGANVLAATNWSVPGGVDCGSMQIRAFGPPYSQARMLSAFDALAAMNETAGTLLARAAVFQKDAAWLSKQPNRVELGLRLAVLAHNWPSGADQIARTGTLVNPNGIASWVPAGLKLPDGTPIRTRIEWCRFYALGWPAHNWPGAVTKYVRSWG